MMRDLRRPVYCALIGCYPRGFRQRFGPEMLDTLDEAANQPFSRLLADLGLSVLRQWMEWDRNGEPAGETCTVVGSVLTGEYPGVAAQMPSSLRLFQAALLIGVLSAAALHESMHCRSVWNPRVRLFVLSLPDAHEGKPPALKVDDKLLSLGR